MDTKLIFISWSGEYSKNIGNALNDLLKNCLPNTKTFFSPNIEAGKKWFAEIEHNLNDADAGLLIVTPDNLNQPWLLYEAGAIAGSLGEKKAIPLLIGFASTDITGPLSALQAKHLDKNNLKSIIKQLNQDFKCVEQSVCDNYFDKFYDDFEKEMNTIIQPEDSPQITRSPDDKIDEILKLTRNINNNSNKKVSSDDNFVTDETNLFILVDNYETHSRGKFLQNMGNLLGGIDPEVNENFKYLFISEQYEEAHELLINFCDKTLEKIINNQIPNISKTTIALIKKYGQNYFWTLNCPF